ncbi:DUF6412 domain-containing protein [Microbacterium sp. C23T]
MVLTPVPPPDLASRPRATVAATREVRVLETIAAVLRLVVEVLAAALRPAMELLGAATRSLFEVAPAAQPETGALVIAVAVVATLALLAVAIAVFLVPARTIATAAHPRRAIADATRLTASHPDAPGHSRPRAPGSAALAA